MSIKEEAKKIHPNLLSGQSFNDGDLGGCNVDGDPGTECPKMWKYLIDKYNIKSVIDIGCGFGYHLKYFHDILGLKITGIEGSERVKNLSFFPHEIIAHDYTKGKSTLTSEFDFGWSVEFVEHVGEQYTENFMPDFNRCKYVVMTHALPGQSGHHHVNCKNSDYWKNKFSSCGFGYDENETNEIRKLAMEDFQDFRNWQKNKSVFRGPASQASSHLSNTHFLIPHVAENALFFYK